MYFYDCQYEIGDLPICNTLQVNDLKQQLALQEVELNKKNEEADKLIEIVGIETERVSREKAIADEEELKVNQINKEVSAKQKVQNFCLILKFSNQRYH